MICWRDVVPVLGSPMCRITLGRVPAGVSVTSCAANGTSQGWEGGRSGRLSRLEAAASQRAGRLTGSNPGPEYSYVGSCNVHPMIYVAAGQGVRTGYIRVAPIGDCRRGGRHLGSTA